MSVSIALGSVACLLAVITLVQPKDGRDLRLLGVAVLLLGLIYVLPWAR